MVTLRMATLVMVGWLVRGSTSFLVLGGCRTFSVSSSSALGEAPGNQDIPESTDAAAALDSQTVQLPESTYQCVWTSSSTSTQGISIAKQVRTVFDKRFQDPRQPDANRFAFDPWFVTAGDQGRISSPEASEGQSTSTFSDSEFQAQVDAAARRQVQYSLKRASLSTFLQKEGKDDDTSPTPESNDLYNSLLDYLLDLGQSVGLSAVTPPWLSLYTDGDFQNFHTDAPHGPLAFVFPVCDGYETGDFAGGETMLWHPSIFASPGRYWSRSFDSSQKGLEVPSLVQYIPPQMGRCIAFDPRIPHGVSPVRGTQGDPRKGRLVIHGWFRDPELVLRLDGFEDTKEDEDDDSKMQEIVGMMEDHLGPLLESMGDGSIGRVVGYLALKLEIVGGAVDNIWSVCDTLIADPEDNRGVIGQDPEGRDIWEDSVSDIRLTLQEGLQSLDFQKPNLSGSIIVPFLFE